MLVVLALVASIGLIGPAAAMWGESLSIIETVDTGEVQVEFDQILSCDASTATWLDSDQEGNENDQISWYPGGTVPGGSYSCRFKITNKGTIPVKVGSPVISANPALTVTYSLDDLELDPDESTTGTLFIDAGNAGPGTYSFSVDLEFVQWNGSLLSLWEWWTDTLHIEGELNLAELSEGNGGSSVSILPQLLEEPDLYFEETGTPPLEAPVETDQGSGSDHLTE